MAIDDLATATEQFIESSVDLKFVKPHPADVERLKKVTGSGEVEAEPIETEKTTPRRKQKRAPKEKVEEDELNAFEILSTQTEGPAKDFSSTHYHIADSQEGSQESSQRRKKRHRHHSHEDANVE